MSTATVIKCGVGRQNARAVYVEIKNGNVYRYRRELPPSKAKSLVSMVNTKGKIPNLHRHWECVRRAS